MGVLGAKTDATSGLLLGRKQLRRNETTDTNNSTKDSANNVNRENLRLPFQFWNEGVGGALRNDTTFSRNGKRDNTNELSRIIAKLKFSIRAGRANLANPSDILLDSIRREMNWVCT